MNRIAWGLALTLIVCALPARADSTAAFLSTRYTDVGDLGAGPAVKYTFELVDPMDPGIQIDLRLSYLHYQNIDLDTLPLEAVARYCFPADAYTPYVGLGAGYHFLEADRGEIDDNVSALVLLGLDWPAFETLDMFAELTWQWLETDANKFFADTEGTSRDIDLNGFGLNIGLLYRF